MACYIYDLSVDNRQRAAEDIRTFHREVVEFRIGVGSTYDATIRDIVRAITHHNALIVPDDLDLHTDAIEQMMGLARFLKVPVYNVTTWHIERRARLKKPSASTASTAAPAMQQGGAVPRPYGHPPPVATTG